MSISDMMPLLRQFGVSPEQLGPEKLEKLMKLADGIEDFSQITPAFSMALMKTLGVNLKPPSNPKRTKIGRNAPCPCKSGRKWKKCCINQSR